MIMFSVPNKAFCAVEFLSVIFASFDIAVEKLNCPVAATFLIVAGHLIDYCGSKHVFW